MADNDKRKFDLPWGTILPVLAVLAGLVAHFKPLVSTRPSIGSEKSVPVTAAQDVDARLWQDPIAVVQKQPLEGDKNSSRHSIDALSQLLSERASKFQVLLLAVMLDSGPYSEQGESRLRARQAVLEGLSESGFVPVDGEHIGFVTTEWPLSALSSPPAPAASPDSQQLAPVDCGPTTVNSTTLVLPWEECEAIGDVASVFPKCTTRVVIVWLPAEDFNPTPLRNVGTLIAQLAPAELRSEIDVKLIGPSNSTGLQNMVREASWDQYCLKAVGTALDGLSIVSARATAPDDALLSSLGPEERSKWKTVRELLEKNVPGLRFRRTIAPDNLVLKELIAELARRRIDIVPQMTPDQRPLPPELPHVVILSEWDTTYGRSLGATFEAMASGRSVDEIIEQPDKRPPKIHSYHYLRGLDGQLPGDSGKQNQPQPSQITLSDKDAVAVEATEGLNQSDYLRRLARQMKIDNANWRREDGFGIRAIGLLGSDIYDKLMILRALRSEFPAAVFFTNNYDAHFERRDDWEDAHNLVIVSPFGSALPETFSRQQIAPFRDSNQTSMYVGTLVATGRMDVSVASDYLFWQPRVFEIGRRGAFDLGKPWYLEGKDLAVSHQAWFRDWLAAPGVIWWLGLGLVSIGATAIWVSITIARRTISGGGTALQRLRAGLGGTIFWAICSGLISFFAVALLAQGWALDEPLAFFSGISIWPSEMLRLIAFLLAIFFMARASFDLRANARQLGTEYSFADLPATRFEWRHLGIGFEQWRMKEPGRGTRFSAEEAWHAYLCRHKFLPRMIRIGVLFFLYCVFAYTILKLFPLPMAPARGEAAFKIDKVISYAAALSLLLLSFYVVDAIQLNSNFIRMFIREVTKWGRKVIHASRRSPPLTEEELSAYQEIFFVAQRTREVARLIWYPLIVLTLIVVARSSFFDNWTWPTSLIVIFAITAAWAVGSAILLRRAAEQLRWRALSDLRRFRLLGQHSDIKRQTFDELIAEIGNIKTGAFAPLTEQPFVQAILYPGCGLGILAVAQRLLDI